MELSPHLPGILLAWSVFAVGVISPGPSVLAIMGTALERGRRPALHLASGVVAGSTFWGILAALGMSAILMRFAGALTIIKIAGGLYLLWLAYRSFRTAMETDAAAKARVKSGTPFQTWAAGFLIHLTNPKAIVTWIATIALGVTADSPFWVSWVIAGGGIVMSLAVNTSYAVLFSSDPMARLYLKAKRPIQFAFAALFGAAGLRLLTSR